MFRRHKTNFFRRNYIEDPGPKPLGYGDPRMSKICAQCLHYLGFNDVVNCCKMRDDIVGEGTEACSLFIQTDRCVNVSMHSDNFRCSICGGLSKLRDVHRVCPKCGSIISE